MRHDGPRTLGGGPATVGRGKRRIYAYAARRLGVGLADDIAAETFLIGFDRRDGYDPEVDE